MPLIKIRYEGMSGRIQGLKKDNIPVPKAAMPLIFAKEMGSPEIIRCNIKVLW